MLGNLNEILGFWCHFLKVGQVFPKIGSSGIGCSLNIYALHPSSDFEFQTMRPHLKVKLLILNFNPNYEVIDPAFILAASSTG